MKPDESRCVPGVRRPGIWPQRRRVGVEMNLDALNEVGAPEEVIEAARLALDNSIDAMIQTRLAHMIGGNTTRH